jgi:SAM-dependent methyltransferase
MIDRRLNYGRHIIDRYAERSLPYHDVVDIGADKGEDLQIYKKWSPLAHLSALDWSPGNTSHLETMGYSVHRIDLEQDPMPFEDCSVDLVNANQIVEHIKEIFWLFHEISRVLRVGGKVVLGVPNLASLHNRLLLLSGRQPSVINNRSAHVRGFTKQDILRFLDIWGGYKVLDVRGSNFYPFPSSVASVLANLFGTMAWALFFLLEKRKDYSGEFVTYLRERQPQSNFYSGPQEGKRNQ